MWHNQNRRPLVWAGLLSLVLGLSSHECVAQTRPQPSVRPAHPRLADRVQATPATVVQLFRDAGMAPRPHVLTATERRLVDQALAALPAGHRRVLKARLRTLSFLDNMPNTALTSVVEPATPNAQFDITIRAGILQQTASEWLTEKERTCFVPTDSTLQVAVEAGVRSALDYVLLHEATHVVDATLKLNPAYAESGRQLDSAAAKPFTAGIWQSRNLPVPRWRHALLLQIPFRRGGKALPISDAARVYSLLQQTPFVSLYGSSSWSEDLAELVTVAHFTGRLHQPFRIVLRRSGQPILTYEPMQSALVQDRVRRLKRLLG